MCLFFSSPTCSVEPILQVLPFTALLAVSRLWSDKACCDTHTNILIKREHRPLLLAGGLPRA